jgi:hypothetical protein
MAYDHTLVLDTPVAVSDRRDDFRRLERIMVLLGASALGAIGGFVVAMSFGRLDLWIVIVSTAPLLMLSLYLTSLTLSDAMKRQAWGCSTAAGLHGAALLAWPITSLLMPLNEANFWIAPVAAAATLVLFASCWGGSARAIYRLGGQGVLIGALIAHQSTLLILGN